MTWLKVTFFTFLTTAFFQCQKPILGSLAFETNCIFDDIQPQVVSKSPVNYKTGRDKRSVGGLFQPIRIRANIRDPNDIMDTSDEERLKKILNGAISIISKILSVVPVAGPLLFTRSGACQPFLSGDNEGKCARVSKSYVGEKCLGDLDNFLIPDEHLEGLWVWNDTHPEPIHQVYANGSGLADTDTVLYVKAEHTAQCNSGEIVAYAAYCKLDQYNRPIAGIINFCHRHLQDTPFDEHKYIVLAVHEIFHVLGFSSSLFEKFKECTESTDGLHCINRYTTVGFDEQQQPRLITPSVTAHAQKHFGCPQSGFGGPLEKKAGGGYSSHWETRMMFGSIMAPVVDQVHQTFLDNLTLAVFEDSGWYKVNYEYAEELFWGKNQGCEFGVESKCENMSNQFFCNDSSSGCHYVHEDKATCSTIGELQQCRIMKASKEDQCLEQEDGSVSVYGEVFHENSRCFVSNAVRNESVVNPCDLKGACYLTRCDNQSRSYEVKVGHANWQACPEHTDITIEGFSGSVHCPSADVICRQRTSILDLADVICQDCLITAQSLMTPSKNVTIVETTPAVLNGHSLCISVEFEEIDISILARKDQLLVFSQAVTTAIRNITNISKSRIYIRDITQGIIAGRELKFIIVTFDITVEESNAHLAYFDLQEAINSNRLQVKYLNMTYTAINIRIVSGTIPTSAFPNNTAISTTGLQSTGVIIGLCLVVLIIVCVSVCVCHKMKHTNAVNPSDLDSSEVMDDQQVPGIAYIVKDRTITQL